MSTATDKCLLADTDTCTRPEMLSNTSEAQAFPPLCFPDTCLHCKKTQQWQHLPAFLWHNDLTTFHRYFIFIVIIRSSCCVVLFWNTDHKAKALHNTREHAGLQRHYHSGEEILSVSERLSVPEKQTQTLMAPRMKIIDTILPTLPQLQSIVTPLRRVNQPPAQIIESHFCFPPRFSPSSHSSKQTETFYIFFWFLSF